MSIVAIVRRIYVPYAWRCISFSAAFDLYSYDHVKTVEYPKLDAIISEKAVDASNAPNDPVIQKEYEIAKASRDSWTKFLADYEATNLKAAANDLVRAI